MKMIPSSSLGASKRLREAFNPVVSSCFAEELGEAILRFIFPTTLLQ